MAPNAKDTLEALQRQQPGLVAEALGEERPQLLSVLIISIYASLVGFTSLLVPTMYPLLGFGVTSGEADLMWQRWTGLFAIISAIVCFASGSSASAADCRWTICIRGVTALGFAYLGLTTAGARPVLGFVVGDAFGAAWTCCELRRLTSIDRSGLSAAEAKRAVAAAAELEPACVRLAEGEEAPSYASLKVLSVQAGLFGLSAVFAPQLMGAAGFTLPTSEMGVFWMRFAGMLAVCLGMLAHGSATSCAGAMVDAWVLVRRVSAATFAGFVFLLGGDQVVLGFAVGDTLTAWWTQREASPSSKED